MDSLDWEAEEGKRETEPRCQKKQRQSCQKRDHFILISA